MVSIYFILRIINSVVISKKVCKKYINYNNRLYYTAFVGGGELVIREYSY